MNRSHTPWLVVGGHRPFYIDSTNAAPGWGDLTVADDLQDALEELFVQYQVQCMAERLAPDQMVLPRSSARCASDQQQQLDALMPRHAEHVCSC